MKQRLPTTAPPTALNKYHHTPPQTTPMQAGFFDLDTRYAQLSKLRNPLERQIKQGLIEANKDAHPHRVDGTPASTQLRKGG